MDMDARMREELSPRGAQRTTRGHALITGGWALRVAGMAVGPAGFLVARASFYADQLAYLDTRPVFWWLRLLAGVAAFFAGLLVFWTGRRLIVRGKQHTADIIDSFDRLTGTRYVLYLRPFSTDPEMASLPIEVPGGNWGESAFFASGLTQEEALVRRFRRFGRVIGIGSPGEPLPLTGAVRAYLPVDDWKSTVTGLIGGAHVVLLSAGPGPGTVWEFTEALRVLPPTRLVLLAYCDPATYARFRTAVAEEYARRSGTEPGAPDNRPVAAAAGASGLPAARPSATAALGDRAQRRPVPLALGLPPQGPGRLRAGLAGDLHTVRPVDAAAAQHRIDEPVGHPSTQAGHGSVGDPSGTRNRCPGSGWSAIMTSWPASMKRSGTKASARRTTPAARTDIRVRYWSSTSCASRWRTGSAPGGISPTPSS
ncbi:hypothetical protein [Streptomyces jumonjinensis]|uniref:hypothetical protein n=1 Tax=Streptomyces jumonjinensis TaxID=1945 RepID=UPI0037A00201